MLVLSDTLILIEDWYRHNQPGMLQSWQPGLTREYIDSLVSNLPFCLSQETYALYQWHNGSAIHFPLESAINIYYKQFEYWPPHDWNPYWLPIATDIDSANLDDPDIRGYKAVVGSLEPLETSLIVSTFDESPEPCIEYPTLTHRTLARASELGITIPDEVRIAYNGNLTQEQAQTSGFAELMPTFAAPDVVAGYLQEQEQRNRFNPEGNYMHVFGHPKEQTRRDDGSLLVTYYHPYTRLISYTEVTNSTGKVTERTYYYQGQPAYRATHNHEMPSYYHYIRTENWLGMHDVSETYAVMCVDGVVRTQRECRYFDGVLVRDIQYFNII